MSNIYLKVATEEKNWRSQNLNFLGLKNLSQCQFWGTPSGVDKFLSRHPNFRARKYKTGCSKQKCISDQDTTRNIALCWDAFGTWMLFDYLKQDAPKRIAFILKTHPSKGAQKNMLKAWNFTKKNVLIIICAKFSKQKFLKRATDRYFR